MHITLAYVASVDGKITRGINSDVSSWRSAEDWDHFVRLRAESDVIILDRKTYETVRPKPEPGKLRIVFTSHPDQFRSVPGQLEFSSALPIKLVDSLTEGGHKKVLLAGGARLSGDFLEAGLIDDLYITIEPVLFGTGRPMFADSISEQHLKLLSFEKLNTAGTLLVHYKIK